MNYEKQNSLLDLDGGLINPFDPKVGICRQWCFQAFLLKTGEDRYSQSTFLAFFQSLLKKRFEACQKLSNLYMVSNLLWGKGNYLSF